MPLVHRRCPVSLKDSIDHRQQRPQLWLRRWLLACTYWRQRDPAIPGHRLPVRPEHPRRLATAVTINKHKTPNSGTVRQSRNTRPLAKKSGLTNGRILPGHAQHHAGVPMACFVSATYYAGAAQKHAPAHYRMNGYLVQTALFPPPATAATYLQVAPLSLFLKSGST